MQVTKRLFSSKQTLSEFMAVSVLYFIALLSLDRIQLNLSSAIIFILTVLVFARLLEWGIALILGEKDQQVSRKYYIGMFLLIPVLSAVLQSSML